MKQAGFGVAGARGLVLCRYRFENCRSGEHANWLSRRCLCELRRVDVEHSKRDVKTTLWCLPFLIAPALGGCDLPSSRFTLEPRLTKLGSKTGCRSWPLWRTCSSDTTSCWPPWFCLLCVLHVGTGNVFDSRGKPSVSPLENYPLELTQPTSCTRR